MSWTNTDPDKNPTWRNTDPRELINKRARILILRPSEFGGKRYRVGLADVDTKEVYNIFTDFDDYRSINADMKWDPLWWWAWAPDFIQI